MSREKPEVWIFEYMRFHGPNMAICKIVSSDQPVPIIGAYLPPSTLDNLPDSEEAMYQFLDRDPVLLGNLNTYIRCLRKLWDQQVAHFLVSFGMVDLLNHFRQCLRYCNLQTWWQVRQRLILLSQCD